MYRVDWTEREGIPLGYNVSQNSLEFEDLDEAEVCFDEKSHQNNVFEVELLDLEFVYPNTSVPIVLRRMQKKVKVY